MKNSKTIYNPSIGVRLYSYATTLCSMALYLVGCLTFTLTCWLILCVLLALYMGSRSGDLLRHLLSGTVSALKVQKYKTPLASDEKISQKKI